MKNSRVHSFCFTLNANRIAGLGEDQENNRSKGSNPMILL